MNFNEVTDSINKEKKLEMYNILYII